MEKGFIPAVFEGENNSEIIPSVEGLIYPFAINDLDLVDENGRFGDFIKIFLCEVVIEKVLKMNYADNWGEWDEIHAGWLTNSYSELCAVDQVYSEDGRDRGSRLYPRLVTSILWLEK